MEKGDSSVSLYKPKNLNLTRTGQIMLSLFCLKRYGRLVSVTGVGSGWMVCDTKAVYGIGYLFYKILFPSLSSTVTL